MDSLHLDGRRTSARRGLFQHGHTLGLWEGDDVVAETTNFTFDPDGIDDHLHPFVGKDAVNRYGILLECYEAQLAWREKN